MAGMIEKVTLQQGDFAQYKLFLRNNSAALLVQRGRDQGISRRDANPEGGWTDDVFPHILKKPFIFHSTPMQTSKPANAKSRNPESFYLSECFERYDFLELGP